MGFTGKREYLQAIRGRYQVSDKKVKKLILDEFCIVCDYSRKYAIRILGGKIEPRRYKPGPKVKYDEDVANHLIILWKSMNEICSKKMKAAIPLWMPFYKPEDLNKSTRDKIHEVSSSSIDRILKSYKNKFNKGLSTTKPTYFIKSKIPIEVLHKRVTEPGYIEADTVAHCGNNIAGKYVNSVTMTDLFSGWTENRATWTKESIKVLNKIKDIDDSLPFVMKGFSCDNGSEFINKNLLEYFSKKRPAPIKFTRRRPYKKNDAAHVEQKNWTHVRQLFNYDRLDDKSFVLLMNEIYRPYWNPLHNYFIPNMKLVKKERIGGKIKKIYDSPKTPFQRIIESPSISNSVKQKLKDNIAWLNPFTLKKELDKKLKEFRRLVDMNNNHKNIDDIAA